MKSVNLFAAAAMTVGLVAGGASAASAAIVCNAENQCWHARRPYAYHPEWGLVIHDNAWRWGPADHYVWREHRGRGYWRNGVWIRF